MEGTTNLWNKQVSDFTGGDAVKTAFVLPIAMMAGTFAAGAAVSLVGSVTKLFRKSETPTEN